MRVTLSHKKLCRLLFCLGIFTKQFYILPSGTFQMGDFFFILSFICVISLSWIRLSRIDFFLALFVFCVAVINIGNYFLSGFEGNGVLITLYYVYNLLVLIAFRNIFHDDITSLGSIANTMCMALFTQLIIFLVGAGRWFFVGRYMGTFNDPNQFGFFVFTAVFFCWNIYKAKESWLRFLCLFLGVSLILTSASTGMMLGLAAMLGGFIIVFLNKRLSRSVYVFFLIICIIICLALFMFLFGSGRTLTYSSDNSAISRFVGKINEFSGDFVAKFAEDRNMMRVIEHPVFLIIGSAETTGSAYGVDFNEHGDIHSDVFSLLFSYGIIPFLILMIWVAKNLRGIAIDYVPVYLGLFSEALTLVNHRQPLFWCLIAMSSFVVFKKEYTKTMN